MLTKSGKYSGADYSQFQNVQTNSKGKKGRQYITFKLIFVHDRAIGRRVDPICSYLFIFKFRGNQSFLFIEIWTKKDPRMV